MQINLTLLLLNMYFSVCIVHFHVIWGPGQFGLKKGTVVDPPMWGGLSLPGFCLRIFFALQVIELLVSQFLASEHEVGGLVSCVWGWYGRTAVRQRHFAAPTPVRSARSALRRNPTRNPARGNPTQIQSWEIPSISPLMWFLHIPTVHKLWDKAGKEMVPVKRFQIAEHIVNRPVTKHKSD